MNKNGKLFLPFGGANIAATLWELLSDFIFGFKIIK